MKRLFDIFFSFTVLLVLLPFFLLIALVIVTDSRGGIFYRQVRVGKDGKDFRLFKFRSMRSNADKAGLLTVGGRDNRITRVGYYLRKYKADELPQLINVLKGEMRLVGNRPLPVYEAEALTEEWMRTRFLAPAGITGLWQISGRSDLSEKERLALDAYYTVTRNFAGDLSILFRTVPALLLRRGAR